MKKPTFCSTRTSAFTLVELLVVIAIIAILAALLLPVISRMPTKAKVRDAQIQAAMIVNAIQKYESDYGRLPSSTEAMSAAVGATEDFTYGGTFQTPGGAPLEVSGPSVVSSKYKASNAEIMAILLDLEKYQNNQPTVNVGHVKNPQRTGYLNAKLVSDTVSPGVGSDGVYRDPWGSPYVITIDLNSDGKARDAFYRARSVSQVTARSPGGHFGLFNSYDSPTGDGDHYECNSAVMVWSAGPDKMINLNERANAGVNKDNILSWK